MENEELYQFLACDYFATGEGRTIMVLITRAYPKQDDYEVPPDFKEDVEGKLQYIPGVLANTAKFRAAREFVKEFGGYFAQGAENLPRDEFFKRFGHHLPEYVQKMLTDDEQPGNMHFKQSFHFNFS